MWRSSGRRGWIGATLAGTHLAACTVYATLYRKSPQGLEYSAGLNPQIAAVLQAAAWEAVQDYFGRSVGSAAAIQP